MIFILVTGFIMAISISLIYRLCRFFDIEMKRSSLVLCAVMAFVVNGAAITMSPFLDRTHYIRLGLLVILAAALVTLFNERLLSREEAADRAVQTAVPVPAEELAAPAEIATDEQETMTVVPCQTLPADQPAEPEQPAAEESAAPAEIAKAAEAEAAAKAQLKARQAAEAAKAKAKAEAEKQAQARAAALAAKQAAEQARREAAQKAAAQAKAAAKEARLDGYRQAIGTLNSLDAILDYAYEHQRQEPAAAICAYQQAIAHYAEDSYTPFLIIELGNLYKDQADYQGAIDTYAQALDMPIITSNDAMKREFHKNIRYLGTVQDILSKHHALSTPFPDLSGEIMQEIEAEFQQRSS